MGILEGIKVIEMGHFAAVPTAAAILADWGAEVIHLEPPWGELARGVARSAGQGRVVNIDGYEVNWVVQLQNRGKKGLAVDLTKESGRDIVYKLVKKSDVFVSNYELSAIKNLKMDYATLIQVNPRIIHGTLTGYGVAGPDKDQRAHDETAAWARSGMQHMIGEPGGPPPKQRIGMMDRATGLGIVGGILAAIIHRDRTGKGQELQFSLYHTAAWIEAYDIQAALVGILLPNVGRTETTAPLNNDYRTKDDRWFHLQVNRVDRWPPLCQSIERPELENDPRFDTPETREENHVELIDILDEVFAAKNMAEWEKCFREHEVIYGRIQTPLEVTTDPQALANDFFTEIQPTGGSNMNLLNTPIKFVQEPASVRAPAPEVGQHNEEILLDLGYTWDDIVQLKDKGVIP